MTTPTCECGHDKRDHRTPLLGRHGYGQCKVCLCDRFVKATVAAVSVAAKLPAGAVK